MRLRHVAGLGEQQRHRVLGRRHDVALRRVDDHHAAAGGGIDVDVVEADPGPADHHQLVGGRQHLVGDPRRRADDHRVHADDAGDEVGGGQLELDLDRMTGGPQPIEPSLGDLFGDQDPRHADMLTGGHPPRQRP